MLDLLYNSFVDKFQINVCLIKFIIVFNMITTLLGAISSQLGILLFWVVVFIFDFFTQITRDTIR